jgi:hypothetical protein
LIREEEGFKTNNTTSGRGTKRQEAFKGNKNVAINVTRKIYNTRGIDEIVHTKDHKNLEAQ